MALPILPAIGIWKLLGIAYGTMVVAEALQGQGLDIDDGNIHAYAHRFRPHYHAGYFPPRPRPHRPHIEIQRYDDSASTTIALVFVVAIALFLLLKEALHASMTVSLGLGALCGIGLFIIRNEPNNQLLRQPAYPY